MITVTIQGAGVRHTPAWETLQTALREVLADDSALMVRIAREDRRADYRGPGAYAVELLVRDGSETLDVRLVVGVSCE